jgi:hypothetical protein
VLHAQSESLFPQEVKLAWEGTLLPPQLLNTAPHMFVHHTNNQTHNAGLVNTVVLLVLADKEQRRLHCR